jgi:hypothetical protein
MFELELKKIKKMQELQDKNQRRTGAPTLDHDVAAVRIQKVRLLLDVDINLVL